MVQTDFEVACESDAFRPKLSPFLPKNWKKNQKPTSLQDKNTHRKKIRNFGSAPPRIICIVNAICRLSAIISN